MLVHYEEMKKYPVILSETERVEFRFDFHGGVGEQDELPESAGPPRVASSSIWGILQHPPAALGTWPQEPR